MLSIDVMSGIFVLQHIVVKDPALFKENALTEAFPIHSLRRLPLCRREARSREKAIFQERVLFGRKSRY